MRYLVKPLVRRTFLRHVCADFRGAEDEIHASGLDWTIFRPPSLSGKAARGTYRTAIDRNLPHCSASPAPISPPACSPCSTTRRPCTGMSASPTDICNRDRPTTRTRSWNFDRPALICTAGFGRDGQAAYDAGDLGVDEGWRVYGPG